MNNFVEINKIPFHRAVKDKFVVISVEDIASELIEKLDPVEDIIKINALKRFIENSKLDEFDTE